MPRAIIQRELNFGIARYATHWHFQKLAGMRIVLNNKSCINKRAPSTFCWNVPLKNTPELCQKFAKWLKNLYNVPLDLLN